MLPKVETKTPTGLRELFHTEKPIADANLCGVRELLQTPARRQSIDIEDCRNIFETPQQTSSKII